MEVDHHFVNEKLDNSLMCTPYERTGNQPEDILTEGLPSSSFQKSLQAGNGASLFSSFKGVGKFQDISNKDIIPNCQGSR